MSMQWFMVWYEPAESEHIAYMTRERMAEIGGSDRATYMSVDSYRGIQLVDQGIAILLRWCRLHCTTLPRPVNVRGKTGFTFDNSADALLFKLTWG